MSWGQAHNNEIGFGYSSEASERNLSNGDVTISQDLTKLIIDDENI